MSVQRDLVVVTGSTGFIGSALIEKLASRFALVGLDKAPTQEPSANAECVRVDLTSAQAVDAALRRVRVAYGQGIAAVIHLAAYFDLTGEPNPLYEPFEALKSSCTRCGHSRSNNSSSRVRCWRTRPVAPATSSTKTGPSGPTFLTASRRPRPSV